MDKKSELLFRLFLGFLGIVLFLLGFYNIVSAIGNIFAIQDLNYLFSSPLLSYFIFGFIFLFIATSWKDIFKTTSKVVVSIALIFLITSFFFMAVNSKSSQIEDSIQPSIDYLVVGSVDDILKENLDDNPNLTLRVSISKDSDAKRMYSKNLSSDDIELISGIFDLEFSSPREEELFSKVFINSFYEQIRENMPSMQDMPISPLQIRTMAQSRIDFELLSSLDEKMLESIYDPDDSAYIYLTKSDSEIIKKVRPSNLTNENAEILWEGLDLFEEVSVDTKKGLLKAILPEVAKQMQASGAIGDAIIPLSMLAQAFPENLREFTRYDVLSNNLTTRVYALQNLRESCSNSSFEDDVSKNICDIIVITDYDKLVPLMMNQSGQTSGVALNVSSSFASIQTKEDVGKFVDEKTSNGVTYLIFWALLLVFAAAIYLLHFKVFNRELIYEHIPYFVFKTNLLQFILPFVVVLATYVIFKGGYFIGILSKFLADSPLDLRILELLPLYGLLLGIAEDIFLFSLFYLIFSIFAYALFYYLLSARIDKEGI